MQKDRLAPAMAALLLAASVQAALGATRRARGRPKTTWVSVTVDSQSAGYEGVNALDGNPATLWHTQWRDGEPRHPHEIVVDLGKPYPIEGVRYLPRSAGGNGTIGNYELYVSNSRKDFGKPAAKGTFPPGASEKTVKLAAKTSGRYVRLRALSEEKGNPWTSIAELRILSKGVLFRTKGTGGPGRQAAGVVRKRPGPDDGTPEGALELARQTLAFVQLQAPRPKLAAELAALEEKAGRAEKQADADDEALYAEVRALRRRIILSHPLLDFETLLINKRPPPAFRHQTDQYLGRYSGIGPGLVLLESWKDDPKATPLLAGKLPPGSTLHPDLSLDARRILFSFCDHSAANSSLRRFFIYEIGLDGTGLRQLTGTPSDPMEGYEGRQTVMIEDYDPCYLPDGGFAFVSTRNQGGVRCHHGGRYCPTYTLYRANGDGSGIHPLAFGEANEWDPSVLHDGRIIWTRWDYINRHDTVYQSLWTTRPDGTATAHFYGNYSRNPCSIAEARAIPASHKVVATTTAHHHYTCGSIIVIDPYGGSDGEGPITRITPEVSFPETEGYPRTAYATPYPLSEDLFLVAYSPQYRAARNSYAIYLIDSLGGRELIYRDPDMCCFAPTPVVPRRVPPVLASAVASQRDKTTGTFYVQNVYQCTEPIPPGSVKSLRVVRVFPQTTQAAHPRSFVVFDTCKSVLGTVPVADDGSAAFRAPAGQPLLFQLLDANGMAVMAMRTFVYLQPGEAVSCIGCHEPRNAGAPAPPHPAEIRYHTLTPSAGPLYEGGLSFARTVQPVLDRYCIRCHGLGKTEGKINLLGTMEPGPPVVNRLRASAAYRSLTRRPGLVSVAHRNRETPFSKPKDYYSHAGRLAKMLLAGHKGRVKLDRESFTRIVDWLDLNAIFYGDYSWNKEEWRRASAAGETALREHIRTRFGPTLAEQPYAALVNVALPSESRILKAPLAIQAGGWGQIAKNAWASTDAPAYQEMLRLVKGAIAPPEAHDIAGTCGRKRCLCRSCWVREVRARRSERAALPR